MLTRRTVMTSAAAAVALPGMGLASDLASRAQRLGRPLRVLVPDGAQANLAPVLADWQAMSGAAAEMVVVDLDNINATLSLEALMPSGQIDVALPATFGIPDLAEAQAIQPLDTFAAQYMPADFGETGMYRVGDRFDGVLWGYQTDGDVYLMFYNRDMFADREAQARYADETGKALDIPRSWTDLDAQMAFFHAPDEGRYGGCLYRTATYAAWEWWARLHAQGQLPFDEGFHPAIAGEAGVTALADMIRSQSHLTGSELGLFANWDRYNKGDIYANIGWGGTQKSMHAPDAPMRGRVMNGPLPGPVGHAGTMGYFNWGWSYVVPRSAPEPEVSYLFCQHAVSAARSGDAVAAIDGYFDPFRKEHYDDPRVIDAYGLEFLQQHRAAMSSAIPDLYVARRGEYFEALSYWLLAALSGEAKVEEALRNVEDSWELTTEQAGRDKQMVRWSALRSAYPEDVLLAYANGDAD